MPLPPRRGSVTSDTASAVDALMQPLYGHSYINPHTVVLGFGDGTLQLHDMRMRRW